MDKLFGELEIGEEFEVYGDQHINYDYPKICRCKKVDGHTGAEMEDGKPGMLFVMNVNDDVFEVINASR